jgi:GNAT superfamily N-acetyltransferase
VPDATIVDLADRRDLIEVVGRLRWSEWGQPPEPPDPQWWIHMTEQETGSARLPATFAALDPDGELAGAIGIGEFDIDERRDRSPWVLGLVVRPGARRQGTGRILLGQVEARACELGYRRLWVANEGPAVGFYEHCGYELAEILTIQHGGAGHILSRSL